MRQYSKKRNTLTHHKTGFLILLGDILYNYVVHNYTKIKGLDSEKITSLRHFSHRRKYTVCSSRDSLAYNKSHLDSYPKFPRSPLGTRGLQTRSHRQKKKETPAFLESRSAKASSTNNIEINVKKKRKRQIKQILNKGYLRKRKRKMINIVENLCGPNGSP